MSSFTCSTLVYQALFRTSSWLNPPYHGLTVPPLIKLNIDYYYRQELESHTERATCVPPGSLGTDAAMDTPAADDPAYSIPACAGEEVGICGGERRSPDGTVAVVSAISEVIDTEISDLKTGIVSS
jgi:hypothetical protein